MNLPQKYLDTMKDMLGDEFDAYLDRFNDSRYYGLRVNTLKITPEEFLRISPFELKPIPWIENGFYFSENDKPAKHPYYYAGLYYIQEPSAMTPANVLPVNEDDAILDMCAAPGGKSTELGAKLNHTGMLVTNDISNSRAKALLKNIEVFGIPNVLVMSEDPKKLVSYYPEFFDKIMIDAPCSGEGMFRKDNKLIKSWEKNGPEFYHEIQKGVLLAASKMLKPGGIMQYSTCTFSKLEDEESIRYILNECPELKLIDVKPYEGFSHGYEDDGQERDMQMSKTVRIWPHRMAGEGHFVALIKKDGSDGASVIPSSPSRGLKIPKELQEFLDEITYPVDTADISIRDERVFILPKQAGNTAGLRVMRTGLLLGEIKKNRFEPSQALAMVLRKDQYVSAVDLKSDDENVIRYLKGETIQIDPESCGVVRQSGWQLVCVDGYPLGWGKLANGTLKNKYLAGWRMM